MSDYKLAQIMYTLGEIAGAVWPNADIPLGIQTTLLSRPYDGLRLMREHPNYGRIPVARLCALLDKVPADFAVSADGLTDEHRRQFWTGFVGEK